MPRKTLIRTGGLLAASLLVLGLIFVFTRPILAPGEEIGDHKQSTDSLGESFGNFFDSTDPNNINPAVAKDVKADSFLIYEEQTGKILAAKNPNTAFAIASITKLMTAYVTHKYGSLSDEWAINSNSVNDIRPVLGLQLGDKVFVKDLFNSMLVGSANDAAAALGAYVTSTTQTPIIELMNKEADKLGMESTHYENPIGFDSEQNYSTANDLKRLLDIVQPMPLFSDLDREQAYSFISLTGKTYSVKATNTLIAQDPEIHAIKTGYTDEAQGAMITAIYHDDKKFIIIVLSSPDRESDTIRLKRQMLEQYGIM